MQVLPKNYVERAGVFISDDGDQSKDIPAKVLVVATSYVSRAWCERLD